MNFTRLGASWKFHRHLNRSLSIATIHRQPHPLPLYPINGDLPGADSASQTNYLSPGAILIQKNATVIVRTYCLGIWSNTWEAVDPRNEEVVVAVRELLRMQEPDSNSCQNEKKASMYIGIKFKINAYCLEKWLTFKLSATSHLIFTSYGPVHTIHAPHECCCSVFNRPTPV
jgi:hypothetical protein